MTGHYIFVLAVFCLSKGTRFLKTYFVQQVEELKIQFKTKYFASKRLVDFTWNVETSALLGAPNDETLLMCTSTARGQTPRRLRYAKDEL